MLTVVIGTTVPSVAGVDIGYVPIALIVMPLHIVEIAVIPSKLLVVIIILWTSLFFLPG